MTKDLTQFSEAQLRRELEKRKQQKPKGELGKRKGKAKVPSGHARKRETLTRKTKKDEQFEKKLATKLKQGHRGLKRVRAEIETKRQARVKKAPRGKYVRQVNWIKLSMWYKVKLYQQGRVIGTYENTIDEFYGIRWNTNRGDTWKVKFDFAKQEMLARVENTLESNAELAGYKFTKVVMKNKHQLNTVAKDPTLIKMLGTPKLYDEVKVRGKPIHYKYIPADLNEPVDGFTCTDSYLMKEYKKRIPSLCQERLDEIMGKINPAEGRSCKDLDRFCAAYSISHYAIDWKHKCFFKEVRDGRNHKALIYYCVNGHLYPVTDAKTRESITKKSAAKSAKSTAGTNLRSALTEEKAIDRENAQIELFKKPFYEDVPVKKLKNYENCNIFYHKHSLYDILIQLYVQYNCAYECMYTADKMTCIIMPEQNVHLFANMNHRTSNPDKRGKDGSHVAYDWNDVMQECDALKVPFMNQSFTGLGKMVQARYDVKGKKKHVRVQFSKEQRAQIWECQSRKCASCAMVIGRAYFEIDHIIPLSKGGDNSVMNLQALCKKCHKSKTNKESAERCFDIDNTQSDYNIDTLKIFAPAKNGFIHNFDTDRNWEKRVKKGLSVVLGFDITKCRTETALRMKDPWCVYSVFDDVRIFDKETYESISPGVYRVVTDNYLPFKGTGWYSYTLIRKALTEKIIDLDDITHCVLASLTLPGNYYAEFINYVRSNVKNINLAKPIINMFIGSMGHKVTKHRKVFLTTSLNEASYHKFTAAESNDNGEMQVHVHESNQAKGLFEVVTNVTRYVESNHVPIFNQILDEEAWQLYLITKLLKKHNCRSMIYYNTDNAIAEFHSQDDADACRKEGLKVFWDAEKKFPKYKVSNSIHNMERVEKDEFRENLVEKLYACKVNRPFTMKKPEYEQLYDDQGSNDFSAIVRTLVEEHQSFQIQGRAGTGKSYMLKEFIKYLNNKEIPFLALCPTHKACRSLDEDAKTLDSQWSIIKHSGSDPFGYFSWVIIDEKSLVKEGYWRQLVQILHRQPNSRFVICGDWDQLPPVGERAEYNYADSRAIWEICDGRMVELTTCRRMDKKGQMLFDMCKKIDKIDLTKFPSDECEKSLAYNNRVRIAVNNRWMLQKREGKKYITIPAIPGRAKETQTIYVYKSMPLIAIESNNKHEIANADEFRVISFTADQVNVGAVLDDGSIDEDKILDIPVDIFPKLLQPAYCVSVHRSQCSTYRVPYTIYQAKKMREMDKTEGDLGARLLYVALSRASDISLINVSNEY